MQDREQMKLRENSELSSRLAEAEKVKANLELEVKSLTSRHEQLVKSQNAKENALINNRQESNLENVKGKPKVIAIVEKEPNLVT